MIVWNVPVMLIGLLFRPSREEGRPGEQDEATDSQ